MTANVMEARPYQNEALKAIAAAEARGVRRPLVAHATGLGKTILFAHLLANRPGRGIVLCHRDELIQQAVDKIGIVAPGLDVGVVKAERNEIDHQVVVASIQSLHERRLATLPTDFTTVVADEAHHAAAPTWKRAMEQLGSFAEVGPLTLGVTATPERADGGLGDVWQEVVHEMSILRGIVEGYLVDVRGQAVGTDADFSRVHVRHGDLVESELGAELERSGALGQIAGSYVTYASDRTGVAFTPTVATAHALAGELTRRGITAEAVDGAMNIDDRRAVLARLRRGETQVVTNCAVLTEGFDESSISAVVIARPTKSHGLYVQMIGRGTRLHPGKYDLMVLDVAGASERHDLRSVADLAGVKKLGDRTLTEAAEDRQRDERDREEAEWIRAAKTKAVDLFKSRMRWLPVENGFCLPAGETTLVLAPVGEAWSVLATGRNGRVDALYEGLPLGYAQGIGEDAARREGGSLSTRTASWLTMQPTEAQLNRLARYGLKDTSKIRTRGQAADLITRIQARRVIRQLRRTA